MKRCFRSLIGIAFLVILLILPVMGKGMPRVEPEEVGLSSERLVRVDRLMNKAVEKNQIAGAVTLIARHGKIAHFKSYGMMDIEILYFFNFHKFSPKG